MSKKLLYPPKSFEHAVVAVDSAVLTIHENKLKVLLIELNRAEFPDMWAVPGGLVAFGETLEESAKRLLLECAGAKNISLEQLYTFGEPDRDPTGWIVSVTYLGLATHELFEPKAGVKYKDAKWVSIDSLPKLAYDHAKVVKMAIDRLRSKIGYTNIIVNLLPDEFTLSELQKAYEIILGKELDKRNFRKKMLTTGLIDGLTKERLIGAHRPAQLFKFKSKTPQFIEIL